MPTKIPHYHATWVAKRRKAFFAGKLCVRCGDTDRLEIDHVDPETKVANTVWSWKKERRDTELLKCQILCYKCHKKKTALEQSIRFKGRIGRGRKLSKDQVGNIRRLLAAGISERKIAIRLGVNRACVNDIRHGRSYVKFPPESIDPGHVSV